MISLRRVAIAGITVAMVAGTGLSAAACLDGVLIERGLENSVLADALTPVRRIDPFFFGFNLEWVEFQIGFWDSSLRRVRPDVLRIMKEFPGAVYRFPGGTSANRLRWSDSIGPASNRPKLPYVSWLPPLSASFGLDEYLDFVQAVGGEAWYVANIYGDVGGARPTEELASNAKALAKYLKDNAAIGRPSIMRWELGNELDRGSYKQKPAEFAKGAKQIAAAIRSVDESAQFVHLQQEYAAMAAEGFSAARYNKELRRAMHELNPDLALHLYYDGVPQNPNVGSFLRRLCDVVDDAQAEGGRARLWITEHARVPNGFWTGTQKVLWPETANLAAAIGMADMVIAAAQIPQVSGAFAHSLVGSGSPWSMLHQRANEKFEPSATLMGMQILRRSLQTHVIQTKQSSNSSGTEGATYAVRSAVLSNADRSRFALWSVNRSNKKQSLTFRLLNSSSVMRLVESMQISGDDATAGNHSDDKPVRIEVGLHELLPAGQNSWRINLPPNSVNSFVFR